VELEDARRTVSDPDYWGSEWYEVYQGNPLLPVFVMVDMLGNVVHVRRGATTFEQERFTVTYLPSWFFAVLDSSRYGSVIGWMGAKYGRRGPGSFVRAGEGELITATVSDRDVAIPLRIEVSVTTPIDTRLSVPGVIAGLRLPQVVYDVEPSHGSLALADGVDPEKAAEDALKEAQMKRVHWAAPSIRITAAPGVTIEPDPLYPVFDTEFDPWELTDLGFDAAGLAATPMWGWFVMNAAQCQHDEMLHFGYHSATSAQCLAVQIERMQNAEALPRPGDPRRVAGVSEVDLLAAPTVLGARFEESTRPDGIDLLFLTASAALQLGASRSDPVEALAYELLHLADPVMDPITFVATGGGLSPLLPPIPVAIRIDPQSPDDRFAYSVCYLDNGKVVAAPWLMGREPPFFRLTVIHTCSVRVNADLLFGPAWSKLLAKIIDFRELVVPTIADVPVAIVDDGDSVPVAALSCRELTWEEIADIVVTGIGLLPWPPAQVFSDLNDYADILAYLAVGTDRLGREMGRVEFAVTVAGLLLPEVLERVLKRAAKLVTVGDSPAKRITAALEAVAPQKITASIAPLGNEVAAP